jgi:hypothetical protein
MRIFHSFSRHSDDEFDEMIEWSSFDPEEEYNDESAHAVSPAYCR